MAKTHRGINIPILQTFICEVFLKRKLLGYCFKTLRNSQLAEMPYPLINDFLRQEHKIRQLEIVQTAQYLFAVAPTVEHNSNPFAINRFMLEEKLFSSAHLLVYGAVVNINLLDQYTESQQHFFRQHIHSIITLATNISPTLIEMVETWTVFHDEQLVPMLFAKFDTSRDGLNVAIDKRLMQYEKQLSDNILKPFQAAILQHAHNQDEFDYLYVAMRQLFSSIISVFHDFQTLPALAFNSSARIFVSRLVAYSAFLEKRRAQIFTEQSPESWKQAHRDIRQPLPNLYAKSQEQWEEYQQIKEEIHLQAEKLAKPVGFFGKLFKVKDSQEAMLEHLKTQRRTLLRQVYESLQNFFRENSEYLVSMEFDSLWEVDEKMRHYAFANGNNGVTHLPLIVRLSENRATFDYDEFVEELENLKPRIE